MEVCGKREPRNGGAIVIAIAACALLATGFAPPAMGAEGTRAEYRSLVEPICQRNAIANEHILAGVRAKVRRGKLKPAGRQFTAAAAALRRTLSQLRKVPRPEADAQRLSEWLGRISTQASLLRRAGRALIDGKRRRAGRLVTRLSRGARLTNALVVGFEFRHCRFDVSRFT